MSLRYRRAYPRSIEYDYARRTDSWAMQVDAKGAWVQRALDALTDEYETSTVIAKRTDMSLARVANCLRVAAEMGACRWQGYRPTRYARVPAAEPQRPQDEPVASRRGRQAGAADQAPERRI